MTDTSHYVTAEEAQEVGCVMSMGRQNPSIVYQTCLGFKCMAWRWAEINDPQLKEGQWDDATPDNGSKGWFTLGWEKRYSATHGYCGMVRS